MGRECRLASLPIHLHEEMFPFLLTKQGVCMYNANIHSHKSDGDAYGEDDPTL